MRDAPFICACLVRHGFHSLKIHFLFIFQTGQRIVARLREQTYAATLRQEVEFVERVEGDSPGRLSVDSSVVGER